MTFQRFKSKFSKTSTVNYRCYLMVGFAFLDCPKLQHIQSSVMTRQKTVINLCTLMLLRNLREPEWISVACNKRLLHFTVCMTKVKYKDEGSDNASSDLSFCNPQSMLIGNQCYTLWWTSFVSTDHKFCPSFQATSISQEQFISFYSIFDAVLSYNSFPLFLVKNGANVIIIKVYKYFGRLYHKYFYANNKVNGYMICISKQLQFQNGINMFHCKNGGYILSDMQCDDKVDCPNDNSDEESCACEYTNPRKTCKQWYSSLNNRKYCSLNYFMNSKRVCKKYDFHKHVKVNSTLKHNEASLTIFPSNVIKNMSACKAWEIPCLDVVGSCFNVTDICVYQLGPKNVDKCRNGGHLENCINFQCSNIFKCPASYCIPWNYVCDGKWDCPNGEDELHNNVCHGKNVCVNMYKCHVEGHKCVSLGNICDGQYDCPYQDDEMFCKLKAVQCPIVCNCLLFAITCQGFVLTNVETRVLYFFTAVAFMNTNISRFQNIELYFENNYCVQLSKSNITSICPLQFLINLRLLNLNLNMLTEISQRCFEVAIFLKYLSLNSNVIMHLNAYSFSNLRYLNYLDLSHNPFTRLPSKCFWRLHSLKLMDLENTYLKLLDDKSFVFVNVRVIKSQDHKLNCICPKYALCTSHLPWYVSCSDILPIFLLKLFYLIISLLTIVLNIGSVVLQLLTLDQQKSGEFKIKVIGLNLSDKLCGCYLIIIWFSDVIFKGVHMVEEHLWESHSLCFIAFGVILWFIIASQLLLVYLSTTRLMAVLFPLKYRKGTKRQSIAQVTIIHMVSICVSMTFTCIFKVNKGHLSTSLCLPLIDPSGSSGLVNITTWIVITSQFISSGIILAMNAVLLLRLKESEIFLEKSKSSKKTHSTVIMQLMITSTSNIICWLSANAVYISALMLPKYPTDLVIWSTVVIMPINSIINPCIFISMVLKQALHQAKTHFKKTNSIKTY